MKSGMEPNRMEQFLLLKYGVTERQDRTIHGDQCKSSLAIDNRDGYVSIIYGSAWWAMAHPFTHHMLLNFASRLSMLWPEGRN